MESEMTELDDRLRADGVIDLDHWWVTEYRVPRIDGLYTAWAIPVVLLSATTDPTGTTWDNLEPERADVELLAKYIEYRNQRFYPQYVEKMRTQCAVDIDPGVNTMTISKKAHSWVYNMATWQYGPPWVPALYGSDNVFHPELIQLLDRIETISGEPKTAWVEFKATHNLG